MKKIFILFFGMALSLFAATTISLDKAEYLPAESITISLAGMPGNEGDWVGIFPKDKPSVWENVLTWKFDGQVTDGNHTLDGVAVGSYEARVFLNNSYTVLAKKAFSVKAPENNVTITTKSNYKANELINITLKNMPNNAGDWVGIFLKDKPSIWDNVLTWKFDGNVTDGNHSIDGVPAGVYEARVFLNNSYTLLAKTEFTVTAENYTTTVTTSATFEEGESITVTLVNMPGNEGDWVGIFKKGDPDIWDKCIAWKFDGNVTDGTHTLDSVSKGEYEVRVFLNNSMTRLAKASFTVIKKQLHTTVSTDKESYINGDDINISVADMLGNQKDWIGIFPVGAESKFETAYDWEWTEAIHNGSILFHGLPAGSYEVRAFFNNEFVAKAMHKFTVTKVDLADTVLEDAENGVSSKWIQVLGKTPAKRARTGANNSTGSLVLTPEWKQVNGNWDNSAEYHLPVDFSIQTVLEMDMGGLPDYKLHSDSTKGYMPHYQVGVYAKTTKGDRVMIWDSYFNHINADAHVADYGNGHIWLQYPSPVEHVRGWFNQSTSGWRHFKVDLEAELHKLEPDNKIIHVYKFYATGGFLDNIKLSSK